MKDNVVQEFISAVKSEPEKKEQIFSATVSRIDEEGTVWVFVAGSNKETPTSSTSASVKSGDEVNVMWQNNKLYIVGNYSDPSSGIAKMRQVEMAANTAREAANNAVTDASRARQAADEAEATAKGVEDIAVQARTDAGIAKSAADKAVKDLSQVENVVGVVNWIAEHGEMISQAGGTFDPAKVYFIVDPNGDYHIGNTHYSVVAEPKAEDIDDYYILNIDESVQNYVMTHLYADSEGLWLIPEDNATAQTSSKKILIAVGGTGHTYEDAGTYIIEKVNGVDTALAQFTVDESVIGEKGSGTYMSITAESQEVYSRVGNVSRRLLRVGRKTTSTGSIVKYVFGITSNQHHSDSKGHLSFTEGYNCACSGNYSHAEGLNSLASGESAHAEGYGTKAIGESSHAGGSGTITEYDSQTAFGTFNSNESDNAFEIGNGEDNNNRSNAFAVDWDGNVKAQGWAGFIQMFAGATAPNGWLFCDGSEVAVADYPLLYAVVGNTYGTPSDSDHFLLPDLRGRTPIGAGQGTGLTNRSLGGEVGAETHKLKGNESGQKSVSISSSGGHTHSVTSYYREVANYGSGSAARPYSQSGSSSTTKWASIGDDTGKHTHSISASDATNAHNNMQPSLGINFIICTGETS